ncbi:MAG: hypothetical protein NUV63_10650 [Gallionella sp.]|nr:hypothetical protein [Gallionella sp.]
MTVISTLITRVGTVHATDSLITILKSDGQRDPIEWQRTKIVPVRAWRGAMSYYGLAQIEGCWSTLDWLREQATKASTFATAGRFAYALADALNREIPALPIRREADKGIGIHFSAYEWINGYWIPELFHISNWSDPTYTGLRPTGVGASADMSGAVSNHFPDLVNNEEAKRLAVHQAIQAGVWFQYNNGDPRLFNSAAKAILDMFKELESRGILCDATNIETIRALTTQPVEMVSNIQHGFCADRTRVVGGRIHDLAITPDGEYFSTSGDAA